MPALTDTDLDAFAASGLRLLGLPLQPDWVAPVRANLRVSLIMAELVTSFPLPDAAEPASVFTP